MMNGMTTVSYSQSTRGACAEPQHVPPFLLRALERSCDATRHKPIDPTIGAPKLRQGAPEAPARL